MASSKTKVGFNMETNTVKENKSSAGSSAGETSPAPNVRVYCLDDLDTIATVGESLTRQFWQVFHVLFFKLNISIGFTFATSSRKRKTIVNWISEAKYAIR